MKVNGTAVMLFILIVLRKVVLLSLISLKQQRQQKVDMVMVFFIRMVASMVVLKGVNLLGRIFDMGLLFKVIKERLIVIPATI